MVRNQLKKSKHNLENSNKYEIMYEISNIYHKKLIPLNKIITSSFREQNDEFLENVHFFYFSIILKHDLLFEPLNLGKSLFTDHLPLFSLKL